MNAYFGTVNDFHIIQCHETTPGSQHKCSEHCSRQYPLQTCFNVCGVVSIMVAVYFVLNRSFYNTLVSKGSGNSPNLFISKPSTYNRYLLRHCLMSWFAEGSINLEVIKINLQEEEIFSDSDVDEDIQRTDFLVKTADESIGNIKTDSIKNENFKTENVKTENIKTDNVKTEVKNSKPIRFNCTVCDKSYTRNNDLKRHFLKTHGGTAQTGNSICLTCGERFYRIADLRKHLVEKHEFTLKMKELTFGSEAG